jgi:DNA-directed RNA polymerase specialized sigma24 family protein
MRSAGGVRCPFVRGRPAISTLTGSGRTRGGKQSLTRLRQVDPWGAARATASMAKPPIRFCIVCGEPFTRCYEARGGRPRLRAVREWRRSLYCSKACCSIYRRRKPRGGQQSLELHLAGLEPPTPPLERREARSKMRAPPGRPATVTGARAIAHAERVAAIMAQRLEGRTLREIALAQGVSVPTVHRIVWRALDQTAPCRPQADPR